MKIGKIVKLDTYNGSKASAPGYDPKENYWKLIGCKGVIIKDPFTCAKYPDEALRNERRVLVKFECSLNSLGLYCHNDIENSLWILVTDLSVCD